MHKLLILSLIFIVTSIPLKAENIKNILINGNKRVSEETIKIYGEVNKFKKYSDKNANIILKNLYETEFFESVKVSYKNDTLIIDLKEYPIINQLIIIGEKTKKFETEIKKVINSKAKKSLIRSNLVKDINIIQSLYSSLGYNFSKIESKLKKIDDDNYDLLFIIERGEKTKISKINFIGNNNVKTKRLKDIIASEEDKFWKFISRNTVLSQNLVDLDKRLISNYYKSIGFYEVKVSSNLAKIINNQNAELTYSVEEGNRFTFGKFSTNVDKIFDKNFFSFK